LLLFINNRGGLELTYVYLGRFCGVISVVCFGACTLLNLKKIVSAQKPMLIVSAAGVEDTTWKIGPLLWKDIINFEIRENLRVSVICVNLQNTNYYFEKLSAVGKRAVEFNKSRGFPEFFLNVQLFDQDRSEILASLETALTKFKR
jgi:hypothetical protein